MRGGAPLLRGPGRAGSPAPAIIPPAGTATATTPAPVTTAATIAAAPCTTLHPVVILVDFPDGETRVGRARVERRFSQQLDAYLQEMSYGKVCLDADVTTKWYTLPHPVSEYRISSRNLEVNKTRVRNLIEDALDAADADVNYPEHSFTVLFLAANTTEYGMVGLNGYPGMLGWTVLDEVVTSRGEKVPGGVAIYNYTHD